MPAHGTAGSRHTRAKEQTHPACLRWGLAHPPSLQPVGESASGARTCCHVGALHELGNCASCKRSLSFGLRLTSRPRLICPPPTSPCPFGAKLSR
eukprot:2634363-Pleurochrysis_carterae.AAC.2